MTTETFTPCDPDTGEVLEAGAAAVLAEQAAAEWHRVTVAAADARLEANRLTEQADALRVTLLSLLPVGASVPVPEGAVVIAPPARRAAQRVDARAAERYVEQFEAIGIGKWTRRFTVTSAEVKAHAGRLIASGVDLDVVMPDPGLGDPRIEFIGSER
jgi:hypothetical protein